MSQRICLRGSLTGDGQTILREALLAADHNAYHIGQFVTVRQLLGAWKPSSFESAW